MVDDQPAGIRTPGRHPHNLLDKNQGGDLHHPQPDKLAGFCNLLRSVFKLFKLGRLEVKLFKLGRLGVKTNQIFFDLTEN